MKYHIVIEGGFTGIPRIIEGELPLESSETSSLLGLLEEPTAPITNTWPDAYQFYVSFVEGEEKREARYSEANLPVAIREFIDRVTHK